MEAGTVTVARRTGGDGEKFAMTMDESFAAAVRAELDTMQSDLLTAATERMHARTFEPASYAEMAAALEGSDGSSAPVRVHEIRMRYA